MIPTTIAEINGDHSTRLHAYHDGELACEQRRLVVQHLATCPSCQEELDNLGRLSELLHQDPLPHAQFAPFDDFWQGIRPLLQARAPIAAPEPSWPLLAALSLAMAGAAVQAAASLLAWAQGAVRLNLLSPAWSTSVMGLAQFAVGPAAWAAGQQLFTVGSALLPDTLGAGRAVYWAVQIASDGIALALGALYLSWVVHWVRAASRINALPLPSNMQERLERSTT